MPKPRFRLRTLFVLVVIAALCSMAIASMVPKPKPYITVSTPDDWEALMEKEKAILFINATWSPTALVQSINYLDDFADWVNQDSSTVIASTTIGEQDNQIVDQISQMWELNGVQFTLKGMHGAGCVVWFKNGKLVGFDHPSYENDWVENRKSLTRKHFGLN